MRILFVSHKFPPQKGGVSVSATRIVQGLARHCQTLHVLHATTEQEPALVQSSEQEGFTVFTLGETDRAAESGQLLETTIRALHQQFDYQAVVGFYAVPTGYQAVFTATFLGIPSMLCLRGNDIDRALYHEGQLASLRWSLEHATKIVGVSRELARKASVVSGRKDVEYVANSVNCVDFHPEPEAEAGHLLFTGEMRLKKGSSILLEALDELSCPWRLTLAGGFRGRAEADFRRWCLRRPTLAARITLLPYERDVSRLRALYNSAALVLNPALWDGMPNSVLEAMACGRPVLATNVGGVQDLVSHRKTGYLVELNELKDLSSHIEEALQDPGAAEVGAAAREFVSAHHGLEREAEAYAGLLKTLVGP